MRAPLCLTLCNASPQAAEEEEVLSSDDDEDFEQAQVLGRTPPGGGTLWDGSADPVPLVSIDLRGNMLASLRGEVSRMKSIRLLQLCGNELGALPQVT